MQKEPMRDVDYKNLTETLNDMKLVQRPKILVAIEEARQLGDLKENAEYHAAKEDQANINKRIAAIIASSAIEKASISIGLLNFANDETIMRRLGVEMGYIGPDARRIMMRAGDFRKHFVASLGNDVAASIGITQGKLSDENWSKLKADLGQMALLVLENEEYVGKLKETV